MCEFTTRVSKIVSIPNYIIYKQPAASSEVIMRFQRLMWTCKYPWVFSSQLPIGQAYRSIRSSADCGPWSSWFSWLRVTPKLSKLQPTFALHEIVLGVFQLFLVAALLNRDFACSLQWSHYLFPPFLQEVQIRKIFLPVLVDHWGLQLPPHILLGYLCCGGMSSWAGVCLRRFLMIDLILKNSIIFLQFTERLQTIFAGLPSNRFIFDTGAIASFLCCLLA